MLLVGEKRGAQVMIKSSFAVAASPEGGADVHDTPSGSCAVEVNSVTIAVYLESIPKRGLQITA